jgi:ATP synthase F1 complex assembly factor 1
MAFSRTHLLQQLTRLRAGPTSPGAASRQQQRRWAQVHDVRFLATTQAPRAVLEKYRAKLDEKARVEGHGDIDALKKAYASRIDELKRDAAVKVPTPEAAAQLAGQDILAEVEGANTDSAETRRPAPSAGVAAAAAAAGLGGQKQTVQPLSTFLKVDAVRTLGFDELGAVWRLRHANDPKSLCAVIPAASYAAMEEAARKHPQFVLPVPHPEQGAEMHFLQWTWDAATKTSTVLFTQLAEYKARGEWSCAHTSLTHYTDLMEDKGAVLMRGSVVDGRGVGVDSARWLVMCLQRFYGGWDGLKEGEERAAERRKLLEWFSKGDGQFSVEKLMEETERIG